MIGDRRPLSIKVQATSRGGNIQRCCEPWVDRAELVINALKHAFQIGETGEILVGYDAREFAGAYRYRTMARDLETRLPKGHTPVSARVLLRRWPVIVHGRESGGSLAGGDRLNWKTY